MPEDNTNIQPGVGQAPKESEQELENLEGGNTVVSEPAPVEPIEPEVA